MNQYQPLPKGQFFDPSHPDRLITLRPYRVPSDKVPCPSCGKKGRFTEYVYLDTMEAVGDGTVGICDRVDSCGHKVTPFEHFNTLGLIGKVKPDPFVRKPKPVPTPLAYIPSHLVDLTLNKAHYGNNSLFRYLCTRFNESLVERTFEAYRVGTSKGGHPIFWQYTKDGKVRNGKIIQYGQDGHRFGKPYGIGRKLVNTGKIADNVQSGVFGGHLLANANGKTLAIVESEKTALFMSMIEPSVIWLAVGSLNNVGIDGVVMSSIKGDIIGKSIILFPDAGKAGIYWRDKAKEYVKHGCKAVVSDLPDKLMSDGLIKDGDDLMDYYTSYPDTWDNL